MVQRRVKTSFLITFLCIAIFFTLFSFFSYYLYSSKYPNTGFSDSELSYWGRQAEKDLAQIYRKIEKNHPGSLTSNGEHNHFPFWLDMGFRKSKELASTVDSFWGYRALCMWYINKFEDNQLKIFFPQSKNLEVEWPGFLIRYQDGLFFIDEVDKDLRFDSLPKEGSELLACDGVPPQILVKQSVLQYLGNPKFEKSWVLNSAHLLKYEKGNPWLKKLKNITVRDASGNVKDYHLEYQRIDLLNWEQMHLKTLDAWLLNDHHFGINEFASKCYWVNLPSFTAPYSDLARDSTKRLREIIDKLNHLKKAKVLVLDLRNNMGGDSLWVDDLLAAIYGEGFVKYELYDYKKYRGRSWRLSRSNYKYIKKYGIGGDFSKTQNLLNLRQDLFTEQHKELSKPKASKSKFQTSSRLYVLTDPWTGGCCLSLLDYLQFIGDAIHVGRSTFGESVYDQARQIVIGDDALINLNLPMAMRHIPETEHNEVYEPRFKFKGKMTSSSEIREWLLEIDREITISRKP
ncbi:MAG: S41 family peptidase [Chlamydiales bacterium]|nr:S41 family peptidase [Chlamydiales bacterium]